MTTIRVFFLQIRPFFLQFLKKTEEDLPLLSPSSYAPGFITQNVIYDQLIKNKFL